MIETRSAIQKCPECGANSFATFARCPRCGITMHNDVAAPVSTASTEAPTLIQAAPARTAPSAPAFVASPAAPVAASGIAPAPTGVVESGPPPRRTPGALLAIVGVLLVIVIVAIVVVVINIAQPTPTPVITPTHTPALTTSKVPAVVPTSSTLQSTPTAPQRTRSLPSDNQGTPTLPAAIATTSSASAPSIPGDGLGTPGAGSAGFPGSLPDVSPVGSPV